MLSLWMCVWPACRSTPAMVLTEPTAQEPVVHPWPMVHDDIARSGGHEDIPINEDPAEPFTLQISGQLTRFNAPVITSTHAICIGSTGLTHGLPDDADGVTCLDPDTREQLWFAHTSSDAHGTSLGAHHLFVGTLAGQLIALDLRTGEVAWTHALPAPVTASPLVIQSTTHTVFIADTEGHVRALAAESGELAWETKLDGGVTSGLSSDGATIFAATRTGHVYALDRESGEPRWHRHLDYLSEEDLARSEHMDIKHARVDAVPVVAKDRLIIAYMREHAQSTPPLMALDLTTGAIIWEATAKTPHHSGWHNQHVSPVLVEDRLIFTEPYSRLFASVSVDTGEMLFLSSKPTCIQQQWSGIVHASDISFAGRQDGVLYTVSQQYGLSPWHDVAVDPTAEYFTRFKAAYHQGDCLEHPPGHDGFLTTPAITAQGHVVVGRADGALLYYPLKAQ
jgi:outer membrane protein assembly factor BamB